MAKFCYALLSTAMNMSTELYAQEKFRGIEQAALVDTSCGSASDINLTSMTLPLDVRKRGNYTWFCSPMSLQTFSDQLFTPISMAKMSCKVKRCIQSEDRLPFSRSCVLKGSEFFVQMIQTLFLGSFLASLLDLSSQRCMCSLVPRNSQRTRSL